MTQLTKHNFSHILFLELLSITPILIILGNIVPPIPMKIHHMGFGLIFCLLLWSLLFDGYKKWILYFAVGYTLIQFTHENWYLKGVIDYFFGPFTIMLMVDLLVNNKLPKAILKKYERRFYRLLWIPVSIAVFQFFGLIPITFWNATYINYAYTGGLFIPRPNGFLFHGSELSIIICFLALFQYFKNDKQRLWILILIIIVSITTYFKAILGCTLILTIFFIIFINRNEVYKFNAFLKKRVLIYSAIMIGILTLFMLQYFSVVYRYTGYYFPSQMLTGRGSIWNIFYDGIKEFNIWQYLFGNGMGTGYDIFEKYANADNWFPLTKDVKLNEIYDSHNALLSIFIDSGFLGLLFYLFLFRIIYRQIVNWKPDKKWNRYAFFAVMIIPLFTIGITIPIYDMAIFWPCLGFLFYRWHIYTTNE